MPWVYLDDHFNEHPKAMAAREIHRDAPWLFVAGLCYARRSDTDGLVGASQVPLLVSYYRPAARDALIKTGLWDETGSGGAVHIHDYSQWNEGADRRSASARNAAQVRWSRERRNRQADGNANA